MKVHIRLKEMELDVLAAMHTRQVTNVDELVDTMYLIRQTEGNFGTLLAKVVAERKLGLARPLRDKDDHSAFRAEVTRSVDALELYGYVARTPVYGELKAHGKQPAKVSITHTLALTPEGARVAETHLKGRRLVLRPAPVDRTSVFVACAFNRPELDLLYERELEPACAELNLRPYKADAEEPAATITDDLLQAIREARIMVADLTHARPSVYFEFGVAHGMGIPFVLTCRSDHKPGSDDEQRVHFDLQQFKISYWTFRDGAFHWKPGMSPLARMRKLLG